MVLQRSNAPLKFWCYALIFVVDCLNYISKKPLGWRTSFEVLNGDTADISPFRFKFWEPVKFLDNPGFPESRWTMGRFWELPGILGIFLPSKFGVNLMVNGRMAVSLPETWFKNMMKLKFPWMSQSHQTWANSDFKRCTRLKNVCVRMNSFMN